MIMRNTLIFITILMALNCHPGTLFAQRLETTEAGPFKIRTPVLPMDDPPSGDPSLKNRFLTGLAGAALGAGIGYFASQVATGSWDEGQGKSIVHRPTWAAIGGASGFVLGFSLPITGRAPGSTMSLPGSDRFIITGEQIRGASVANAMEAVRFFHPEWLQQQRPDSFEDFRIFTTGDIPVYLDNARLGGIDDLAEISAIVIKSIRFFNTQEATVRWGTGHRFGAIQVLTQD